MELDNLDCSGERAKSGSHVSIEDPPIPTLTKRQELTYLAVLYWTYFTMGFNDGSSGPLLSRIEQNYNIGFAVVSLIFVASFIGFGMAAILTVPLTDRLGFGKICIMAAVGQVAAFAIEASAPPFPVFALAFLINGFSLAMLLAQGNVFIASLPNSEAKLQLFHAFYGAGATVSPLIATQFAQLPRWSFQYLITLCFAITELVLFCVFFRFKTQSELLGVPVHAQAADRNKYRQILRLKTVHLLSAFILIYVGLEVSIGGWIVTYLVDVRGGGPSAGYVSSGFWGGLTLGRVTLIWVNEKLGARRAIFLYLILAIILEIIVWFVPSMIGDAVAISAVGLLLGPFYPMVVNASSEIFPQWLLAGCIGWISSFGQAGAAVFPFLTGILAQKFGIKVFQPLLVAMMTTCVGIWAVTPLSPRRSD